MKAVRVPCPGASSVLEVVDLPVPEPGPGEVLIELEASGVNFLDIQQRLQRYPAGITFPYIAGVEGAGHVAALGPGVDDLAPGERVAVHGVLGCYAEAIVAPRERVVKVPDPVDARTAAAALIQGLTGWVFTTETYAVRPGDWVLVHAGAGGTGRMLVQAARMRGAVVVATVSSADKARVARAAGANHVIRYTEHDFVRACRALAGFAGFAAIYDNVGGPELPRNLPLLRKRGVLVSMGKSGGEIPPLQLDDLNRLGSLYVTRPNMAHYVETRAELEAHAAGLFAAIAGGRMKVLISETFALEQAAAAQDRLASRATVGKLLLIP